MHAYMYCLHLRIMYPGLKNQPCSHATVYNIIYSNALSLLAVSIDSIYSSLKATMKPVDLNTVKLLLN